MTSIAIRVDANDTIATGHLMRCLSIAHQLATLHVDVLFISADEQPMNSVTQNGFRFISLNSVYSSMEDELDTLVAVIKENSVPVLLIDSYHVTAHYLHAVRKHTKTAYIDDIHLFPYPVDILINYNINHTDFDYNRLTAKLLLGTEYVPLRTEFMNIPPKNILGEVKNILITTGGADEHNMCGRLIHSLREFIAEQSITLHIVVGGFFKHKNELLALENCHVVLHQNANMSSLMQLCDICISAGGSTTYELCACSVPSVLYSLAENQVGICNKFHNQGVMLYVGAYDGTEEFIDKIAKQTILLVKNHTMRKALSLVAHKQVDGLGAKRIAQTLIKEANECIYPTEDK